MTEDIELQERPPRNLRTHADQTLAAMARIEGEKWLREQGADRSRWHPDNVAGAVAWLQRKHAPTSRFVIGGYGGMNRWLVKADGRVLFMQGQKAGTDETAARARALGFEVHQGV